MTFPWDPYTSIGIGLVVAVLVLMIASCIKAKPS